MVQLLIAITLLAWGVAGIFDKQAVQRATVRDVFVRFHLFNVPVLCLLVVLSFIYPWGFSLRLWEWQAAAAAGGVGAMLLYYIALRRTDASYVLGITAAYPVISTLLAPLLVDEHLSTAKLVGAALVSLGVAMIGFTASESRQKMSRRDFFVVIPCVLVAAFLWGAIGIFEKLGVAHGTPLQAYVAETFCELVIALCVWRWWEMTDQRPELRDGKTWKFAWLSAAGVAIGNYAVLALFAATAATYAIIITACYPLVMYVLAVWFLKEKVSVVRVGGICLVIVGGVLTELLHLFG